jgi:hypothetical protein
MAFGMKRALDLRDDFRPSTAGPAAVLPVAMVGHGRAGNRAGVRCGMLALLDADRHGVL